jgi:hypothetical protein
MSEQYKVLTRSKYSVCYRFNARLVISNLSPTVGTSQMYSSQRTMLIKYLSENSKTISCKDSENYIIKLLSLQWRGWATAQVVRRSLLTPEDRVQSRVNSCEIHGGPSWFLSQFPLPIITPPLLHTHLSPPPVVCNSPDQAAHYHILGL